ncbi:hypothetical protein [Aquipseudomonas alcaligenes]|uniref:hypothetical protein n=1 Tax=Aquipseudomonas alcaligenes TaxID=43263 RepID=UPI0012E87446|nr:hypothetical protein [Pseudomonas alcaligenes]
MADNEAYYTDKQITAYLLCSDCEQRFSKFGELPVSKMWATKDGFPLLERLSKDPRVVSGRSLNFFPPEMLGGVDLAALFYFGASVIWRSHWWDWGSRSSPHKGMLGDTYENEFRRFLLGEISKLSSVRLLVALNTNFDMHGMISFPYCGRQGMSYCHQFDVLGIRFSFVVGKHPMPAVGAPFDKLGADTLMVSADMTKTQNFLELAAEVQKIEVRGKAR